MIAAGDTVGVVIGRRNIEGGPRMFGYEHTTYSRVRGVKGDINDAWTYDTYGSYYDTDAVQHEQELRLARPRRRHGPERLPGQAGGRTGLPVACPTTSGAMAASRRKPSTTSRPIGSPTARPRSRFCRRASRVTSVRTACSCRLRAKGHRRCVRCRVARPTRSAYLPDQTLGSGDLSGSGGASPTIDADTRRDGVSSPKSVCR